MRHSTYWIVIIGCLLLLSGCNHVSVNGQVNVKVNADGSSHYQFTILTHPVALKYFQTYQTQLKEQNFQITSLRKGKQVGWKASKPVDHLLKEPIPLSLSTTASKETKQAVKVDKGFYQTQIHVNYPLDLTQITEQAPLITLIQDRIHLKLSVSLPVPFEEQNATTLSKDKKTATWQLKVGEVNPLQAKVTVPNPAGWIVTIVGGAIILLILVIMIIFIMLRKKRHRR